MQMMELYAHHKFTLEVLLLAKVGKKEVIMTKIIYYVLSVSLHFRHVSLVEHWIFVFVYMLQVKMKFRLK